MKNTKTQSALIGWGLVAMAVMAGLAFGALHPMFTQVPQVDLGTKNLWLVFLLELGLWWGIFVLDIVISVAMYHYIKARSTVLGYLVMGTRLGYSAILGLALVNLSAGLVDPTGLQSATASFDLIWSRGLIIFGVHLLVLGIGGFLKSPWPWWLSTLLILAGIGYILVQGLASFGGTWKELSQTLEAYLAPIMALGELVLAVWMIVQTFKSPKSAPSVGSDTSAS